MTNSKRPEIVRFHTKTDATERVLRALANVGFVTELETDEIAGVSVGTYYPLHSRKPDMAAVYTDNTNGNQVTLGLSINGYSDYMLDTGPFNWRGQTLNRDARELAANGNHDTNQPEFVRAITSLVGAAHFNVETGHLPTWTEAYIGWEAMLLEQLDPIYSDTSAPQK